MGNFYSDDYIEYESNDDKDKNLSIEGYLNKNKKHLKNIIVHLQKSDNWKIQLT